MNLLDIPWEELPMITGMGNQIQIMDERLRRIYNNLIKVALANPDSDIAQKKVTIFMILLLTTEKNIISVEIKTFMRSKLQLMSKDEWSQFTLENFIGRSEGRKNSKSTEDRGEDMRKYDAMSHIEKVSQVNMNICAYIIDCNIRYIVNYI